jgi:hypothetical protein
MQDSKVDHVWYRNGEEVYRFTSDVKSPRWRTNSRMQSAHFKSGDEIAVEVVGPDREVHEKLTLKIR